MKKLNQWRHNITGIRFGMLVAIRPCDDHVKPSGSRETMWLCSCDCGKSTEVRTSSLQNGNTKSCGCLGEKMRIEFGRSQEIAASIKSGWVKGKHINKDGYVVLPAMRARSAGTGSTWFEHRLVMEQHLGRKLSSDETVHHKNGMRADNRLENLELWASRHVPGQRVDDLVSDAVSILRKYNPSLLK